MSRKLSKSHKNKISNAMKGRSLSEEQKAKIVLNNFTYMKKGKTLQQKISNIYNRRQKAHDELLACDIELDKLIKEYSNFSPLSKEKKQ